MAGRNIPVTSGMECPRGTKLSSAWLDYENDSILEIYRIMDNTFKTQVERDVLLMNG